MGNISVDLRLRPIRFAFLVRPDDGKRLLQIFQINTCLWGGKFNPIIPYFKQVPKWWNRQGRRFESAKQIINGYLDYFEPDFIVEAEKGIAKELGFHLDRVLQLEDILIRSGDRHGEGYGISANDIYGELYRKEFQFTKKHKHNVMHVKAKDASFKNFVGCIFGTFPSEKELSYFARNYKDVFDPEKIDLTAESLIKIYTAPRTSPLKIGQENLEVNYNNDRDPALFILKAHEPRDLLDFWNLRAIRRDLLPIPIEWIQDLSPLCKDFVIKNHRPLPGNPNGVMIQPTIMFSRSIPEKDIDEIHKQYCKVDKDGANCIQVWYPSIWRPDPEFAYRTTRPTLKAAGKKIDLTIDLEKPSINFPTLYPEFIEQYGSHYRFANVVRLSGWGFKDQIATAFPCDYKNPVFPRLGLGGEQLLPTAEGLVFFPRYKDISEHWDLAHGTKAINDWLNKKKIKAEPSDGGIATQQIIQTLEGFWGVGRLASAGIVKLLDEMSRSLTRSMHFDEFKQKVQKSLDGSIWHHKEFETLVDRKAVELGLELKCIKCGSKGWHPLKALDYSVTCDLCLQKFDFPVTKPTDNKLSRWAYRVIGPFALPNYAKGGYAAALAIRFFSDVMGKMDKADVTWSAGQELTLPSADKVESDFILWYQRKQRLSVDYPTEIIFGEAKSFGKDVFKDDDINGAKLLAETFPGAVLVFATMKEGSDLSQEEILRIRKLAEWGRVYDREREETRAPVIVLTATELFAPYSIEEAWKAKGGQHAAIVSPAYIRLDNLRILADFTQQLYLGMPSYHQWLDEKWRRRKARMDRRQAKNVQDKLDAASHVNIAGASNV